MNDRYNKTSICSIVFLDIIDFSKKRDSEQIEVKNQFNALIKHALKGVAENDRIILDTGDGAAIACQGSPEDVLYISLTLRDEILKSNTHNATPLYVRFGINLGPVRVVKDINGRPNIVGDGINVSQRIMSFAKPNQILVSRSYYEVTSRLTQEISKMFDYSGIKHDKHVREHEVYSVRLLKEQGDEQAFANVPADYLPFIKTAWYRAVNAKYAVLGLMALVAFLALVKQASLPTEPVISMAEASDTQNSHPSKKVDAELAAISKLNTNALMPNETLEAKAEPTFSPVSKIVAVQHESLPVSTDTALDQKKTKQNTKQKYQDTAPNNLNENVSSPTGTRAQQAVAYHPAQTVAKPIPSSILNEKLEKTNWENFKSSVKQGSDSKCSQVQISMNQCG